MLRRYLREARLWFQWNIYNDVYTGEITEAQRLGMAAATNSSFSTNNFTYYYTEAIGPDTAPGAAPGDKLYIVRSRKVDPDNIVEEARRFAEYVRSGNAFTSATPGTTTTTAATTTTTTAATTTTTTTA